MLLVCSQSTASILSVDGYEPQVHFDLLKSCTSHMVPHSVISCLTKQVNVLEVTCCGKLMCQSARVSKSAKFRSQARMFLTSGYVLIVRVLVKSAFLHTFRSDFLKKGGRS